MRAQENLVQDLEGGRRRQVSGVCVPLPSGDAVYDAMPAANFPLRCGGANEAGSRMTGRSGGSGNRRSHCSLLDSDGEEGGHEIGGETENPKYVHWYGDRGGRECGGDVLEREGRGCGVGHRRVTVRAESCREIRTSSSGAFSSTSYQSVVPYAHNARCAGAGRPQPQRCSNTERAGIRLWEGAQGRVQSEAGFGCR